MRKTKKRHAKTLAAKVTHTCAKGKTQKIQFPFTLWEEIGNGVFGLVIFVTDSEVAIHVMSLTKNTKPFDH